MNMCFCISSLVLLISLDGPLAVGQADDEQGGPLEVPDHAYVPVERGHMQTSPPYRYSAAGITTTQVNVDEGGQNIVGDAANEPSIAINPNDPSHIVIGWRQFDTIASNFRQAGYGYTTDGGATWNFPGVIEPGVFRSDPVLDFDADGNFYYNSLTVNGSNYTTDVYKSTTGGSSWDNGTFAHGGDKQWMAIDRSGSTGEGNIYSYWTQGFSSCYPNFFTRSVDNGASFQSCVSVSGNPFWGTLAVGPDGELYACGSGFVVAKSTSARDAGQNVTWDFSGSVSLDGQMSSFGGPNPGGLLGQAWVAVDNSNGSGRGHVYLLCSVDRSSNPDPLDVMFSRSTDGGSSWSAPVRVNDDPGTSSWQWFGTMSVAPSGRIDAAWLDTRGNPGSYNSALYYSYSTDGGVSWSTNEQMSESFNPQIGYPQQQKIGDYFHMVSADEGAHLAWAATFNGEQDVYYSFITPESLPGGIPCVDVTRFQARCRPGGQVQARIILSDDSHNGEQVTFAIDDVPYQSTIGGTGRATISVSGFDPGTHAVELTDPAGCFDPINVSCSSEDLLTDLTWEETSATANRLFDNYPDPFNPTTTIRYELNGEQAVTLRVYDMLGRLVRTLVEGWQGDGYHEVSWDGRNESGGAVAGGMYLYRLAAGDLVLTKKMVMIK